MAQSDFWNKLKARLREVSIAAADFTEEQALIGKLKFDILNLKRKIEHKQNEIGVRVCELSQIVRPKPKPLEDEEIVRLLGEIAEIEKQVEEKRKDITKVADQVRTRGDADTAKKTTKETTEKPKKKPGPKPGSKRRKPGPKPGSKRKKPGPKRGTKRKKSGTKKTVTPPSPAGEEKPPE